MFAEFELKINELVQNGGSLTAEGLNKIYHDLNVFYYGDAVVVDDLIDREWARIPHFYYNYYVFQYSTGFSAAMALSERILSEGEPAVKDYQTSCPAAAPKIRFPCCRALALICAPQSRYTAH